MSDHSRTTTLIRRHHIAALLLIGWWCVVFYTPSSVFFRDSGEFILAALYLDIVHPPGYPLYAQLSNLLALIPAGPIGWRVHLFSGLAACGLLCLTGLTTYRLIGLIGGAGEHSSFLRTTLTILAPLWLITSPAFLRGALAAEAYVLNGCFLLTLLNCFISYRSSGDRRWLIGASFIGGLSLGNHVSGALSILPVALLVIFDIRRTARAIIPGLIMGVIGLGVYGYIPVRSFAEPPLNTGSPNTPERLLAHLTNARDRVVRSNPSTPAGITVAAESGLERITRTIRHDLRTLVGEISPVVALGALAGLLILLIRHTAIGLATSAVLVGNLAFFSGWDPDPWAVSLALTMVLASVSLTALVGIVQHPVLRSSALTFLVGGALATTPHLDAPLRVDRITDFSTARLAAHALADPLPAGAPFITEASWFITRYLHTVEGYRSDLVPIYQPSILFPQLFTPLDITIGEKRLLATAPDTAPLSTAHVENLDQLIDRLSQRGPVFFEPTIFLNARLRAVAKLDSEGRTILIRGESHQLEEGHLTGMLSHLRALRASALDDPLFFGGDTQQYFETLLTYHADLLRMTGHPDAALTLIEGVCPSNLPPCSSTTDINRALYFTDLERFREAVDVLLAVALREPGARVRLIPNLQIALSRLAPEEIEELGRDPLHRTLIAAAGY